MIPMFCPSCSCSASDAPQQGEDFYSVKNRLRQHLGEHCPRRNGFPCPMRGESAKRYDRETRAALADVEELEPA